MNVRLSEFEFVPCAPREGEWGDDGDENDDARHFLRFNKQNGN